MKEIKVITNILQSNEEAAAENKALCDKKGIFVVNLMSSPGAGKTTLLEKMISTLKGTLRLGVIEGDVYTTRDAARIGAHGIPVVQINTEGGCHLDAVSVRRAMESMGSDFNQLDILVIENVGNLVCPAEFELGEDIKMVVLSTPEGSDKVLKYPMMFEKAAVTVLNKIDLMALSQFDFEVFAQDLRSLHPNPVLFETSCITGAGIPELCNWLKEQTMCKKAGK